MRWVSGLLALGAAALAEAPRLDIQVLPDGQVRVTWPESGNRVQLEKLSRLATDAAWQPVSLPAELREGTSSITLEAGWDTEFFRLVDEGPPLPAVVVEMSPAPGEGSVSVNREVILRLSRPLAEDAVVTTDQFQVSFAGHASLTRVQLSSDRRALTCLPLEPLPAGARVRVTLDGDALRDDRGQAVDADGDGQPGGQLVFEFDTSGIAPVPGTAVIGSVFATDPSSDGRGSFTNRPLAGVTITVDGAEETLRTVTDASGHFRLEPAPAGRFFVHVDGRTSPESQWPGGAYYPFIGKAWEAEAGRTNNLAGGSGEIFLPRIPGDALVPISATDPTEVTFSPTVLAQQPELEGVRLLVPPNALFAEDGTRGGRVGLAPVPPDRLPEPLPPGLDFPLVITVQTDGPQNFDAPVPVQFPNLPDPVTGERLGAGEQTALWSFNHDTGRWEIQGTMTISPDGRFAVSDPGVGIRQPGWHGVQLGAMLDRFELNKSCLSDPGCRLALITGGMDLLWAAMPIPNAKKTYECLAGAASWSAFRTPLDCLAGDRRDCGLSLLGASAGYLACFARAMPILDKVVTAVSVASSVGSSCATCFLTPEAAALTAGARPGLRLHGREHGVALMDLAADRESELAATLRWLIAYRDFVRLHYGSQVWTAVAEREPVAPWVASELAGAILEALGAAQQPTSEGGSQITEAEATAILERPRPSTITESDVEAAVAQVNRTIEFYRQGVFTHAQAGRTDFADLDQMRRIYAEIAEAAAELQSRAVRSLDVPGMVQRHLDAQALRLGTPASAGDLTRILYVIEELPDGASVRGRLGADGRLNLAAVRPNTAYRATFYEPQEGLWSRVTFSAAAVGRVTAVPRPLLIPVDEAADADDDGLPDVAEWVIGTNPANPDTDGDGLRDGLEVRQGGNPLDGQPAVIGVIASAPTTTPAIRVAAEGGWAVTVHGGGGLTVFDVSNLSAPLQLTRVATPGEALALAVSGRWVAVAVGSAGVALVRLDDPVAPRIERVVELGGIAQTVTADAESAYVGLRSGELVRVELVTGTVAGRLPLGAAVDGVAMTGDLVAVLTRTALVLVEPGDTELTVRGSTNVAGSPLPLDGTRTLFVGGGLAYVGHFTGYSVVDIRDPETPRVIGTPPTSQSATHGLAATGSGRLLALTSFAGQTTLALSLFDSSDPTQVNRFLVSLDTPGTPRGVVLDRGFALVADGARGLQVVNHQAPDTGNRPPVVTLETGLPVSDGLPTMQEGRFIRATATATDDVQVRQVDFFLDGLPVVSDGSFPFEQRFPAPFLPPDRSTATLQARAVDTGGNVAWSDPLLIRVTPDSTPPTITSVFPRSGAYVGQLAAVRVGFSRALDPASLGGGTVRLIEAGPDGELGTTDDQQVGATIGFDAAESVLTLSAEGSLPRGTYEIVVADTVRDLRGNPLGSMFRSWFATAAFPDADGDGMPDALEEALGLSPTQPDTNGNGVWDGDEDFNGNERSNAADFFASQPMTPMASSGGRTSGSVTTEEPGRAEFDAEAGVTMVLRLGAAGFSPRLQLYNPLGEMVAQSAAVTGSARDVEVTYTNLIPGRYRVLVTSYFAPGSGTFELSLANPGTPVTVAGDDDGGPLTNGGVHHGSIPVGDLDVWSFEAQAGEQLFLRIGTTNISPRLRLFGPDGAIAVSVTGPFTSSRAAMIQHRVTTTGRYLVAVTANFLNTSGGYHLRLARLPEPFVVSDEDEGGALNNGMAHAGLLPSGDFDLWSFAGSNGDTVVLRAGTVGVNPRLRLYDPDGVELAAAAGPFSTSRDATLTARVLATGTYTVVLMADNIDTVGTYSLHLARVPGPFTVSPGDEGGPLTNGVAHAAALQRGDLDLWSLDAQPGDSLVVRAGADGFNPRLRLYGPDGAELASAAGPFSTSRDARFELRLAASGVYSILVMSELADGLGTYTLHTARVPAPVNVSDGDEGGPLTNGASHPGELPRGDVDLWTLEAQPGDTVALRVGATGFNPRLRLYGPDGAELASESGPFNTSRDAELTLRAVAAGTYQVLVDAASLDSFGSYRLSVARVPGDYVAGEDDEGGRLTSGLGHAGDLPVGDLDVWFTEAQTGQTLVLRAGTTGFNPRLRVLGPDGAEVAQAAGPFNTSRDAALTHRVLTPGQYTVLLDSAALGFGGDYRLHFAQVPGEHVVGADDEGGLLTAGLVQPGTLPLGDVDTWTVVAVAGEALGFAAETMGFNPQLRLYGPDGALVASAQGSFNTSRAATLTHLVTQAGLHTLTLQAHALGQAGTYELRLE